MTRTSLIGIVSSFSLLLVAPLFAQTPPPSRPGSAVITSPVPPTSDTVPSGTLQKVQSTWRGRTLIGAAVFDDNGQRIAAINDLLIADDGRVDQVILSAGRLAEARFRAVQSVLSQSRFFGISGNCKALNSLALVVAFYVRRRTLRQNRLRALFRHLEGAGGPSARIFAPPPKSERQ